MTCSSVNGFFMSVFTWATDATEITRARKTGGRSGRSRPVGLGEIGCTPHLLQAACRACELEGQPVSLVKFGRIGLRGDDELHAVIIGNVDQMNQPPRSIFLPLIQDRDITDQQRIELGCKFEIVLLTPSRTADHVEVEPDGARSEGASGDVPLKDVDGPCGLLSMRTESGELPRQHGFSCCIRWDMIAFCSLKRAQSEVFSILDSDHVGMLL